MQYTATSIHVDFKVGCITFIVALFAEISRERWQHILNGARMESIVSEEEAAFIRKIAIITWGIDGCEVIGGPRLIVQKAECLIRYTAFSILLDFEPGHARFSYQLGKRIDFDRLHQTGEGIRLGCEISEDEVVYIKSIANAEWEPVVCEVIGMPEPIRLEEPEVKSKPVMQQNIQLSLF
jgi:hypothetical protein